MYVFNKVSFHRLSGIILLVVLLTPILSACGTIAQPPCSYPIGETFAPYLIPFEFFDPIYAISTPKINSNGQTELVTPYFTAMFDQTRKTVALKPVSGVLQLSPLPGYLRTAVANDAVFGDLNTIRSLFANAVLRLGPELAGAPLVDGLLYNDKDNRFEMYFANLGFYMAADGKIHLLNYGAWANAGNLHCASEPVFGAPPRSLSALDADYLINERMKLLDQDAPGSFIGFAITPVAYLDPDSGLYLKAYYGGVVALNPADPDAIGLVNAYVALGFARSELESPRNEPGTMFYEISDGMGYNIREDIYNWVGLHSGRDLSGKPVMSTYHHTSGDINCFEAYCVIVDANNQIKPVNLGERYVEAYPPPAPAPIPTAAPSPTVAPALEPVPTVQSMVLDRVTVQPWDTAAGLIYGLPLYVHAGVFSRGSPVPDAPLFLILYLPDGSQLNYDFPLTNERGMTSLLLEKFKANNGDIIQYEVCLNLESAMDVCTPWFFTFRQGP